MSKLFGALTLTRLLVLGLLGASTLTLTACSGGLSEDEIQARIDQGVAKALADAQAKPAAALQAQRFELVDASGTPRALLTTLEGGRPSLSLLDQTGEARAWIYLSSEGAPRLVLTDRPLFVLADQKDELRSVLRLEADGTPSFALGDAAGTFRTLIRLAPDGTPAVLLQDKDGKSVWAAPPPQ